MGDLPASNSYFYESLVINLPVEQLRFRMSHAVDQKNITTLNPHSINCIRFDQSC